MKKILTVSTIIALASSIQANIVSVTDGTANNYGKTSGIAIDFDATSGLTADWSPGLVNGQIYRVDSVALFLGAKGTINEDLYLGVYTGINEQLGVQAAATLSGFIGVSDNTFNLSTANLNTALTWTFTGDQFQTTAGLNPGTGSDILYFMLQTGTDALADTGTEPVAGSRQFRRIDGTNGSFENELSAVIHASANGSISDKDIVSNRPLEYEAQVTAIPEPASLGLIALFGGSLLFIRRIMAI